MWIHIWSFYICVRWNLKGNSPKSGVSQHFKRLHKAKTRAMQGLQSSCENVFHMHPMQGFIKMAPTFMSWMHGNVFYAVPTRSILIHVEAYLSGPHLHNSTFRFNWGGGGVACFQLTNVTTIEKLTLGNNWTLQVGLQWEGELIVKSLHKCVSN